MTSALPRKFGRYELLDRLGQGGMAEVFRARISGVAGFEKLVCVKRIHADHLQDAGFVEMFVQEAVLSARLSHPNIVSVFDLGEVDDEFFMAMELVDGRDVLKLMAAAEAPLPPPAAASIARDVARALAHAHELTVGGALLEVVHRDVSLQNIMVGNDGTVKLLDFGIAKAMYGAGPATRTGVIKGKFAYLAPEQLGGTKASPRTDVFALGIVLWEMLTGERLFASGNAVDTLKRLRDLDIPAPSSKNRAVPPSLDRIAALALARDPAERYGRAAEMARDLDAVVSAERFSLDDMRNLVRAVFAPARVRHPNSISVDATPLELPVPLGAEVTAEETVAIAEVLTAVSDSMLESANDVGSAEPAPAPAPADDTLVLLMARRAPAAQETVMSMRRAVRTNEALTESTRRLVLARRRTGRPPIGSPKVRHAVVATMVLAAACALAALLHRSLYATL